MYLRFMSEDGIVRVTPEGMEKMEGMTEKMEGMTEKSESTECPLTISSLQGTSYPFLWCSVSSSGVDAAGVWYVISI